jgi:hypothetical protein
MARGGQAERQRLNLAAGWERRDVVYQYANGWTLEQVVTPADQRREGELMGNCAGEYLQCWARARRAVVARGEYLPPVPERVMLSLRDPRGRPHVDVIVLDGEVLNIEGRACTEVKFQYVRMIGDFARAAGVRFDPARLKRDRAAGGRWNIAALEQHERNIAALRPDLAES